MKNNDIFYLINKKRKLYRRIYSYKIWINTNTPVGDAADFYELKPYGGKKLLDYSKIVYCRDVEAIINYCF